MANPQTERFETLASAPGIDAVSALQVPDGTLVLVARDAGGEVVAVEGVDRDGRRIEQLDPLAFRRRLGEARKAALVQAAQITEALIAHLAMSQADGEELKLTELHRDTGIARQTLYARLEDALARKGDAGVYREQSEGRDGPRVATAKRRATIRSKLA